MKKNMHISMMITSGAVFAILGATTAVAGSLERAAPPVPTGWGGELAPEVNGSAPAIPGGTKGHTDQGPVRRHFGKDTFDYFAPALRGVSGGGGAAPSRPGAGFGDALDPLVGVLIPATAPTAPSSADVSPFTVFEPSVPSEPSFALPTAPVSAVPAPGSAVLIGLAGAALGCRRRRRG